MCQIQFIKRLNRSLKDRDIQEFFKLMELGSLNNNCAFGFFNDKAFFKRKGRFNLLKFDQKEQLKESSFIVGHNRLATSGDRNKNYNNHPFRLNDFILVHNGIINNEIELRSEFALSSKIETDSFIILWLINHYFKKSKSGERAQKIVKAIQKTTKKVSGSYSVFLYDRLEDSLYFFKNKQAEFSFCMFDSELLVGTTNPNNLNHIFLNEKYVYDTSLFRKREIKRIKDNHIYLINKNDVLKELGEFENNNEYCFGYCSDYADDFDEIDRAFELCIGYLPEYTLTSDCQIIKVKKENNVLRDLEYFIDDIVVENNHILFCASELVRHLYYLKGGDF